MSAIKTDVLIVGTGPAGASLACFLGYHGITGLMISREKSTALQPRAHITNMATWECFRDVGLEEDFRQVSLSKQHYGDYRYCHSLTGSNIIRLRSYGLEPHRLGDYEEASPCAHADVSQNVAEPILQRYATQHGFQSRFNCEFVDYVEDESTGLITSNIHDHCTNERFQVVSKYLCGADGAGSRIAAQAGLAFNTLQSLGAALNVWYEADLSHVYANDPGLMTLIYNPYIEAPAWSMLALNRVVGAYSEFVMSMVAQPGVTSIDASEDEVIKRVRELVGDDRVQIKVKGIYRWRLNESYAEMISKGNVFCLGDAIHRHSPGKGLGANTSFQDAYNLAWKLAYVLKGKAGPKLLESYNLERQPVGKYVVRTANDTLYRSRALMAAMGITEPTIDGKIAALRELGEATPAGRARRAALKEAREGYFDENSALGAEMNQAYVSSAVYLDDETEAHIGWPQGREGIQQHIISTVPGSRLPHAWLGTRRTGQRLSTHDLAGKGRFSLFTGVGGADFWSEAIKAATRCLQRQVEIALISVGFGQEYSDMYYTWEERRGVNEDGAVLVRPDRTVAWRCEDPSSCDVSEQLIRVMQRILGRE